MGDLATPRPLWVSAAYAYPTSTWATELGRKAEGCWLVQGYRSVSGRPEPIAGPFADRQTAERAAACLAA